MLGAVLALLAAGSAAAEESYGFVEFFSVDHDDRFGETDASLGAGLGLGFPIGQNAEGRSSIELGAFATEIDVGARGSGPQYGVLVNAIHALERGNVDPYFFGGLGVVQEEVVATSGTYPTMQGGLGLEFGLSGGRAVRAGISVHDVFNSKNSDDGGGSNFVDYRFTVSYRGAFGPAPAPVVAAPSRPVDTDGDGVPDAQDRCPTQPAATADGCPAPVVPAEPERDTDADGVPDSQDTCPGTLGGLTVDASGCTTAAQSVVLKGVTFPSGSAELTADAKAVLDTAHEALAGQPKLRVEIGGYTDSSGDDKLNQALSQRRAESVRAYLVGKGIAADRLTAKGYGEANPIADNKTRAGRQENRRVELKTLD